MRMISCCLECLHGCLELLFEENLLVELGFAYVLFFEAGDFLSSVLIDLAQQSLQVINVRKHSLLLSLKLCYSLAQVPNSVLKVSLIT